MYKKIISLILCLCLFVLLFTVAYSDPVSIAIGGFSGVTGAGLFGSIGSAMGINVNGQGQTQDNLDLMWSATQNDPVQITITEMHKGDGTTGDEYDYIVITNGGYDDIATGVIDEFVTGNQLTDNDSGNISTPGNVCGLPFNTVVSTTIINPATEGDTGLMVAGPFKCALRIPSVGNIEAKFYFNDVLVSSNTSSIASRESCTFGIKIEHHYNYNVYIRLERISPNPMSWVTSQDITVSNTDIHQASSIPYTTGTIDTDVGKDYEAPRIKIPSAISGLTSAFTAQDFLTALTAAVIAGQIAQIVIDDNGDTPVPPAPLPTTPLGNVPFDEWYDLYGQSVNDGLQDIQDILNSDVDRLLQGINDDTTDLVGLNTSIDENLQDGIQYLSDIENDTDSINENVEDIEDEVIIIVDELGNVVDVLEDQQEIQEYLSGKADDIADDTSSLVSTTTAISTDVSDITDDVDDIKDAVVPYIPVIPQTITQTATQTQTAIQNQTRDITTTITGTRDAVIQEIQDATQTITDDIPNITEICLNIDEAPLKDTETAVDNLPTILLPFITDLRSALGIWHYVVSWVSYINGTLSFITLVIPPAIMFPIYAGIAGTIVIKVYRRMCG